MLMVGDKIRMVKEIPGAPKIDGVFEVKGIQDGIVSLEVNGVGAGIMSYDEFEKYFEKCGDDHENSPEKCDKRMWSPKMWSDKYGCYYRTNGKTVKADCVGFCGSASCSPYDKFDLDFGIKLAYNRARAKMHRNAAREGRCDEKKMIAEKYGNSNVNHPHGHSQLSLNKIFEAMADRWIKNLEEHKSWW